jgi:hypothetical protein
MSYTIKDRLYNLLPAIYRRRDIENGQEALRALLGVVESEFESIVDDIDTLYDNWFIETCQDWVVPYIGDLLGARELNEIAGGAFSRRAFVANTLAYRQRKGTPSVVEQIARDTTGWPGHVVEYFQLLGWTQHLAHLRPRNQRLDLRHGDSLELLGSPFEQAAYTADVRHIGVARGRYNIPNVGIHLWRLEAYPITKADAVADTVAGSGYYRFSQAGNDINLFNRPQTEQSITTLAQEINVPAPLRRRPLYDELEARRAAIDAGDTPTTRYFGTQPVFELFVDGADDLIAPEAISICDLSTWRRPATGSGLVSVDPVLGRIAFADDAIPTSLRVSYSYGFSADAGGGSYNRRDTLKVADPTIYKVTVSKSGAVTSLQDAIDLWMAQSNPKGIIEIADSATYTDDITLVMDHADGPTLGEWLVIQAQDGERPTIAASWSISAGHTETSLTLNGLLVASGLSLPPMLAELNLVHSTLIPGWILGADGTPASPDQPSILVHAANESLQIDITSSILGAIEMPFTARSISIADSIVDGLGGYAISGIPAPPAALPQGPRTSIVRSTVFGRVVVQELELASESIFTGIVESKRRQVGCARFCYLPEGSQTPRRYHCQPSVPDPGRVRPAFTSGHYGQPGYAQLTLTTATEIRSGAEDGSEMGVFSRLKQPQRQTNLRIGLDEYMRLGLDTGIFFVT